MQETQETELLSLGPEDPLEKEMETHSNIIAWEIPWTEGPGRLQTPGSPWGHYRVGHDLATKQQQQQQIWKILLPSSSIGKESACNAGDSCIPVFDSWVEKILWRKERLPTGAIKPWSSSEILYSVL